MQREWAPLVLGFRMAWSAAGRQAQSRRFALDPVAPAELAARAAMPDFAEQAATADKAEYFAA